MLMFFRKNWIHIGIWTGMLLYLVLAHNLYNHFYLRNGKPVLVNAELPEETDQIMAYVDFFEPTLYDGQYSYSMIGWAFSTNDPEMSPEDYERQVVLISNKKIYFFLTEIYPRPDVQEAFQSLGMELTKAGYTARISKDVIVPGVYQVGIVFHNPKNESTYYAKMNKYLIRTPNQFQMSNSPTLP